MLFLRLLPLGQGYVPLKLSDDNKRRYYCQGESQSDYCNSPSAVKTCKIIRIICFCRTEYIYIVKSRRSIYTVILLPVIFIYADFVFGYFLRIARRLEAVLKISRLYFGFFTFAYHRRNDFPILIAEEFILVFNRVVSGKSFTHIT